MFSGYLHLFSKGKRGYNIETMKEEKRMKEKIEKFMVGRYGEDQLNNLFSVIFIVLAVINWRINSRILRIIVYILIILSLYRTFSKNVVARSIENDRYIKLKRRIARSIKVIQKGRKDKENKYVLCPNCVQMIRVPRKKGRLEIKCPNCHKKFEKRT